MNSGTGLDELRERLASFAKRTLRRDVLEYIKYTERKALTQPFNPTDDEQALYERISAFLQKEDRSEEHTSELQSLMRISYAVFCLKKKNNKTYHTDTIINTKKQHIL